MGRSGIVVGRSRPFFFGASENEDEWNGGIIVAVADDRNLESAEVGFSWQI